MTLEIKETITKSRFRRYAHWFIVTGTAAAGSYFLGFLVYHSLVPTVSSESWFLQVIEKHFAATIGVPLSAVSAFCIVLLLNVVTPEPIEIEALGFKFCGASGPIVLWIFCFLAMIVGMPMLWGK